MSKWNAKGRASMAKYYILTFCKLYCTFNNIYYVLETRMTTWDVCLRERKLNVTKRPPLISSMSLVSFTPVEQREERAPRVSITLALNQVSAVCVRTTVQTFVQLYFPHQPEI